MEDLSEQNQFVLRYSIDLLNDDQALATQVDFRKNQILGKGVKIPLFSGKELENAKKHRNKKVSATGERFFQSQLWSSIVETNETFVLESVLDPDNRLTKVGKSLEKPFPNYIDKVLQEETKKKKVELREKIGLPIVKRGDKYCGDHFYISLVTRVVRWDIFRIFDDYCFENFGITDELSTRIEEVGQLIGELKNSTCKRYEKYEYFDRFVDSYSRKWNIKMDFYNQMKLMKSISQKDFGK